MNNKSEKVRKMSNHEADNMRFYIVNNGKRKQIVTAVEQDGGFVYYDLELVDGEKGQTKIKMTPIKNIVDVCGSPNIQIKPACKETTKLGNPSFKFIEKIYKYIIMPSKQEDQENKEEEMER